MKTNEERYLKEAIRSVKRFAKEHETLSTFFAHIDEVKVRSLQDLSFKYDLKFFDNISRILSVIISIVSRPTLANKGEEVIVRAASASRLTPEMFQKTVSDSTLWKQQGADMVPEYVYYQQYVDEIKTYENIFIVHLINLIDSELTKFQRFYISMIQSYVGQDSLSLDEDKQEQAMVKVDYLQKKIVKIKNTYFYRIINKDQVRLSFVIPTNILLHNHLYNECFKFYRKLITYNDEAQINKDFFLYNYVLILKQLKQAGFKLYGKRTTRESEVVIRRALNLENDLVFFSSHMKITMTCIEEENKFIFKIVNREDNQTNLHLLIVDKDENFDNVLLRVQDTSKYTTIEAISLWLRAYLDDTVNIIKQNLLSEVEMIKQYFEERYHRVIGSQRIYSIYCPICRQKTVNEVENNIFHCESCNSLYKFYQGEKEPEIVFLRLRRKN